MILSNVAIKNRVTVLVLIALILALGAMSYRTLPREAAPDVEIPHILVSTTYDGVSPEDIENTITKEIEKELTGISGLEEVTSSSEESKSIINCEFQPDVNIDQALRRVKDKVDIAELPTDPQRKEPRTTEINVAEFPIMMLNVSGDITAWRLKGIADDMKDRIKTVDGVLDVEVLGTLEREIRIEIDQDRVAAYGIQMDKLLKLVSDENVNISAGALETKGMKFNVRVPAEFIKAEDIQYLTLDMREGKPIYLSDVATVSDTFKDRISYSRLDGKSSITLAVKKRIGANIVHIAEKVKDVIDEFRTSAPASVRFVLTTDRSDDINLMVRDLENNILTALVLVVLVLVAFMGLRSSLIVAFAIPTSMLMSFALIQALGYTLNMIVLFSLILALGMLVDNAIVIVENIYRHRQLGAGRIQAAMKGTAEVAWPVIASTATTVAAFSPLLFWPGMVGDFMKYLPTTVIIVLSSSLFVAMVISPVLCSVTGGRGESRKASPANWFVRGYRKLLTKALNNKLATLTAAAATLVSIVLIYSKRGAGRQFFPDIDSGQAVINIRNPQGTNIDKTDGIAKAVEKRVEKLRFGPDGSKQIKYIVGNTGTAGGFRLVGRADGPHVANVTVVFPDFLDRPRPTGEIIAEIRESLQDLAGGEIKVEKMKHGPPAGAAITVRVIGEDFSELEDLSEEAKDLISDVPNMVNLRSDLEARRPELRFEVDRDRAKKLGVDTRRIGFFLKAAVFGLKAGSFRQFNDEHDITVRLPKDQRGRIDDLLRLRVPSSGGKAVPLSSLGHFEHGPGYGNIYRVDEKRVVTLTADVEGRTGPAVLKDVQDRLKKLDMPAGYRIEYAGEKEEQDKAFAFLGKAFGIAVLLMVMILVTQFNTFSVPLIILTTVILSTTGVFIEQLAFDRPFHLMIFVGVISLAGVVVNNAIVLLDYTRKLQKRGLGVVEAAINAGQTRLRPVLLTAATTILGLVPMATGFSFNFHTMQFMTRSESSQWWSGMSTAVIFGLSFATILTLVVVPCLYVALYSLASRFGLGGLREVEAEQEVVTATADS
ncbi:MAG: efflux RND transporter permease subunit [Planctomycetota bacterium]|jgi:multidrug efflux pump subunit AcrB